MTHADIHWIANYIWGICDDVLRDTEQVPLQEEGGIEGFLRREVLPYAPDAWYQPGSVKIGYEISFNRYFYKPQPMRTLEEIRRNVREAVDCYFDEAMPGPKLIRLRFVREEALAV